MRKKVRLLLNIALSVLLAIAIVNFSINAWESHKSRHDYDEAKLLAGEKMVSATDHFENQTPIAEEYSPANNSVRDLEALLQADPHIADLLSIDLDSLREVNEDVIGWIEIPDTKVSYPLLQWEDNDFYLNHTWKQAKSGVGSIFMEYQNSSDFSDFNTIIYGHNMTNKDMFGSLRDYKNKAFLEAHPSVYIVHDLGIFRYDVFAVQKADVDSIVYGMKIETDQKKAEYIRYALDYSSIETGLIPTAEDQLLTLSTCSGSGYETRWVVQCILNEEGSYRKSE